MKQALQRYSHILSADDHYRSWQEVLFFHLNCYMSDVEILCQFYSFSPEVSISSLYMIA